MIVTICSIYREPENLLPHYLKHYLVDQQVDQIRIGVYDAEGTPLWESIKSICQGYPVTLHDMHRREWFTKADSEFINEHAKTLSHQDWIVPTDLDEFHVVRNVATLRKAAELCEANGDEMIMSEFVDMTTNDGSLNQIDPNVSIWEQFPTKRPITKVVMGGCPFKLCLTRPYIPMISGHHPLDTHKYKMSRLFGDTYHFKWFGKLYEREREKRDITKSHNLNWWPEKHKIMVFLDEHDGKIAI